MKLEEAKVRLENAEEERQELWLEYQRLLDKALTRADAIIDERLGLNKKEPEVKTQKGPVARRQPWRNVAHAYESKQRNDYWTKKIETVEKEDLERKIDGQPEPPAENPGA